MAAVEQALDEPRAPARRRRALRARDDRGHERAAGGHDRSHRAGGHRGLRRPRGAGPPGAARAVPALRGASAAARPARAAGRGAGALRARRGAARARPRRARPAAGRPARRRRGRRRSACCGAFATPSTSARGRGRRARCRRCTSRLSHEVAGVFREYERLATTVVDAALSPLLARYLARLTERTGDAGLPEPEVMLSSGGVADAATAARHGSWTVLSGPAGRRGRRRAPRGRPSGGRGRASTWAARRATSRWCSTAAWR